MWRAFAFLTALVCALGAVDAHGGRFDARLDFLSHFAPVWLAGGLFALLVAIFLHPRPRATLTLAMAAIVAAGALMAPELLSPRPRAPAGDGAFRIVQFNVWGRNEAWPAAARRLLAEDADVIVLEEFKPGLELPADWTARYPHVTSCAYPAPCDTVIFSRHPALARRGLEDGTEPFLSAAWTTLSTPDGPVTVVAAHYTRPNDPVMLQDQSRRLARVVRRLPRERMIVAGDFNLTPWSSVLRRQDRAFGLARVTRALPTWPAGAVSGLRIWTPLPIMPIDHVYIGSGWQVVDVKRGPKLGSDHYPVVVTLSPA